MIFLKKASIQAKGPPDLILLYLGMPLKDGLRAIVEIKSDPALHHIPMGSEIRFSPILSSMSLEKTVALFASAQSLCAIASEKSGTQGCDHPSNSFVWHAFASSE